MSDDLHELRIMPVESWASRSAELLANAVEAVLARQERCLLALSGGSTPGPVFEELASCDLPWQRVVLLQADERLSPDLGARNLTQHHEAFAGLGVTWLSFPVDRLLADGELAPPGRVAEVLGDFTACLVEFADEPPVIDIAQLGLGTDGHTASLFPGDPAVEELRRYVAVTEPHGGWRRLTMTRPVFDRARIVIWLARGAAKAAPLGRLLAGDLSIPAGMLRPRQSVIVADTDAARQF
ncbi:MAG: 6-phosphogluconolactonase [Acidimicrobiia bacterium]|nr:6-phosphogluconolactonase [Acidimicrobiia bacterium]